MVKLALFLLFLSSFPMVSYAEYDNTLRTIPLQTFKERFTMEELIDISAAYSKDAYIHNVVSKLSEIGSVELDSALVKNVIAYLTSKSIISMDRSKEILK